MRNNNQLTGQLAEALRSALAFIEMKLAHTGAMSVEQIEIALESARKVSHVTTGHHVGCSRTTRSVNLQAARRLLAAYYNHPPRDADFGYDKPRANETWIDDSGQAHSGPEPGLETPAPDGEDAEAWMRLSDRHGVE